MTKPAAAERPGLRGLRAAAGVLAKGPLFARARALWDRNVQDLYLPLSKAEKAAVGLYVIFEDLARGRFPPREVDQREAYSREIALLETMPGMSVEEAVARYMAKPFLWPGSSRYLRNYATLVDDLRRLGLRPPARLLELGCGSGWVAEFLAMTGFDVTATTLSPQVLEDGAKRLRSVEAKGLEVRLQFRVAPMESVDAHVADLAPFDCVFVHEALHHAYDWRATLRAARRTLAPGAWMLLAEEPNVTHTAVSYRVAKLTNTHEIGFRPAEVVRELRAAGFEEIRWMRHRAHLYFRPLWIAARTPR